MEAFLVHMGVNPTDVFAAFSGGVCAAFIGGGQKPTLLGIAGAVLVGTGVGTFGGPVAPGYVGLKPSGFMTFLLGLCGMPIAITVRERVSKMKWPGSTT